MQHRDRETLIGGIERIVDEVYGQELSVDAGFLLRRRLNPLLDEFLLEAQPIRNTETTILLADIRGFTALTRTLPAETIGELLNRYFSAMCDVIKRNGGVVDKFMGDAVMALFGAPWGRADDLQRALACAVEMQQAMVALNRENLLRGWPNLFAGIAINTGPVMAGSFGSKVHSEYTVIRDAVNLVARIESFSLRGQILLSETAHAFARDLIDIGSVNKVRVKGVSEPIVLYEMRSVNRPRRLVVPEIDVRRSPRISVDLKAMFRQIDEKRVADSQFPGHVNDMGYFGLSADLPMGLPACSEVSMTMQPEFGLDAGAEVYARVLRSRRSNGAFRTSMEFTAVDTPGHRRIKAYVDNALWHS